MRSSERRFEKRFICADLVRVEWDGFAVDAVLEDISPMGACVQVEESIRLGMPIELTIGENRFSGVVSYSVYRDYGYFVGVRFADDTEWSVETVIPQHLTDLSLCGHE